MINLTKQFEGKKISNRKHSCLEVLIIIIGHENAVLLHLEPSTRWGYHLNSFSTSKINENENVKKRQPSPAQLITF